MRLDVRTLFGQSRPFAEPIVGMAFLVFWLTVERGQLSFDLVGMRRFVAVWILVVGAIALSIAISRIFPRIAISIALAVVITQYAIPVTRFWYTGWPVYSGFLVLLLSLGFSAPLALRRTAGCLVSVMSVLVSGLLTIPALGPHGSGESLIFARSADMGAGSVLRNYFAVLAVALVGGYLFWLIGLLARRSPANVTTVPVIDELSAREREVFGLAARGLTNADIARSLFITEATVKSHMTSILAKLGLHSRSGLIAFAHESELVDQ